MLGDEERYASLAQAAGVLLYHIVTHDLDVASVGLQQKVAHDVCLGCQGDAMVYLWVGREELLQHFIVFGTSSVEWQVEVGNLHVRVVVVHVVQKSHFSVVLLLTHHSSVLRLSHEHDFRLPAGNHHQHLGCKISAAERVLSVERQGLEVGHVGVEKNEGNVLLVQLVGELSCDIE